MNWYKNWLSRWRLRRIVMALHHATEHGMRPEVRDFAKALEATSLMAVGQKSDTTLTITCTPRELNCFITYITNLHNAKLSLMIRARIGLAALALKDRHILGETPEEFVKREYPKAKSSKDDNLIQLIK